MTIFEAIAGGDEEEVRKWIRRGVRLGDEPDDATYERLTELGVDHELAGVPPLHLAAGLGRTGIVRRLLAAGAAIDQLGLDELGLGATPLSCAAGNGHAETVAALLAAGADVRRAAAALFETDDLEILKMLISAGADLEAIPHEDGGTLLMVAAADDDVEKIRFLLEAGADPRTRDDHDGGFALSYAGARGLMQVMPFWLKEIGRPDDNLFDIATNLRYGCPILRYYYDLEDGRLTQALARYNGSRGQRWYPDRVMGRLSSKWFQQ